MTDTFACPPDCGWCCTHLQRDATRDERAGERGFRDALREIGVYGCTDAAYTGLALSPDEARALGAEAERRGLRTRLHPRTWLLESRRRIAVVLDWHLAHEVCPFYADYKCTAYELRPLVCRAFPVLAAGPAWSLAPRCPKTEPTLEAGAAGRVRLNAFLRPEATARRSVERRHEALDARATSLLDRPGARFVAGLPAREAGARLRRYRQVTPQEFDVLCPPPATR